MPRANRVVGTCMNASLGPLRLAAIVNGLRQCALLSDCPPVTLEKIASLTTVRTLDGGKVLFTERTPVTGFFIVQQGALKLHHVSPLGRQQLIHIFRPHEPLAEETLVSDSGYPATACATEPSQVFEIEKTGFLAMLRNHPELALSLLRSLSLQVEFLVGRLDELTLKDVPTRLADWLLQHCPDPDSNQPQTVQVAESKRRLASELGTRSETLSRTLAKFRDQHLLRVDGRNVTLLCPARLAQSVHAQAGANSVPASCRLAARATTDLRHMGNGCCRSPNVQSSMLQ